MPEIVDILMPESDEEGTEAMLETWLKQVGDEVEKDEPVLEIATDKVTMEVSSPVCGVITEILVEAGSTVEAGMLLGRVEHHPTKHHHCGAEEPDQKQEPVQDKKPEQKVVVEKTEVRLSPAVKSMIAIHSLDANMIPGSGRSGRVTVKDVENFLQRQDEQSGQVTGPDFKEDLLAHNNMRLQIADHMILSALETTPHVTAIFDCDMSNVVAHRARHKADFSSRGARLTYTAYFVYATVQACRHAPIVNGQWMEDGIKLFDHCNVGVATALGDDGLIVPVIKNAQDMDLFAISQKLEDLATRARTKKLSLSDVKDGTISLTNHGTSGSLMGTPIINQPQNAIVGLGKMEKRVKVVEVKGRDEIQIKPMIYVSLTFDHRGIDGFTANTWLSKFVETLEKW